VSWPSSPKPLTTGNDVFSSDITASHGERDQAFFAGLVERSEA
jgi:hypothetical protein